VYKFNVSVYLSLPMFGEIKWLQTRRAASAWGDGATEVWQG